MISKVFTKWWVLTFTGNSIYYTASTLTAFNKIFYLQSKWEPLPLEWNSAKKSFETRGKWSLKYWIHYFNVYCICAAISLPSVLVVLANPTKSPKVNPAVSVISLCFGSTCIFMVACITILIKKLDTIQKSYKCTDRFIHDISHTTHSYSSESLTSLAIGPLNFHAGAKLWKRTSVIYVVFQVAMFLIIYTTPLVIYFELDTQQILLSIIFPCASPLMLIILRTVLSYICLNEICRATAFLIATLIYFLEHQFVCLSQLYHLPIHQHLQFFRLYNAFRILHNILEDYIPAVMGSAFGCVFVIFIVANVGTLKLYGALPLPVYLIFPLVALVVFLVAFIAMPFVVHIARDSQQLIVQRTIFYFGNCFSSSFDSFERKIIRRRYACLRRVAINCGGLYPLARGAESDYFFYVLLRTVDVVLTVDRIGYFKK